MAVKFTNNAKTTLASSLTNVATSASVVDGSVFPTLGAGEYFYCTFDDGSNNEIVKVTARSGNTLTIVRGVDNTSARAFSSGDSAELRATAGLLTDIQENIAAKSANQTVYNTTTASSATDYDIGIDPSVEANAMVFLNGVMQHHDTFSFSGSTLTFDAAPPNGMALEVIVDNLINLQSSNLTVDTFTAADVGGNPQTDFTLSDAPAAEDNLLVFIDGVFQDQDAYTISNQTLTITDGVTADFGVTVYVINPVNIGTPSDGTVTSAKLSGNITMPADLTVTGDVAFDSPTFVVDNANSRVGIGTASPSTLLDIVGDVKMSANLTVDTTTLVVDATNNRVGIGNSNPRTNLHIGGSNTGNQLGLLISRGSTTNFLVCNDGTKEAYIGTDASNAFVKLGSLTNHPVSISQNNGTAIYIDTSKNVGIGTSNPSYNLHVEKSSPSANVDLLVKNTGTDATSNTRIMSYVSGASGGDPKIGLGITGVRDYFWRIDNSDSDKLILDTNGTDILTIDTSGNVGIGTTSPSGKLEIAATGTNAAPHIKLVESGDTREFNIYNDGSGNGRLVLADSDDDTSDTEIVLADNGNIQFKTATSERMIINSSGNVGIGTSSPSYPLHVQIPSDGSVGAAFRFIGGTNNPGLFFSTNESTRVSSIDASGSTSGILAFKTSGTEAMRIDSSGDIAIGSSTVRKDLSASTSPTLSLEGTFPSLNLRDTSGQGCFYGLNGDTIYFGGHTNTAAMLMFVNGSEKMRIDSSGRLFVGKTVYNNDDIGVVLGATQTSWFTAQSITPLGVNRKGTDGILIQFTNDQAGCGTISCSGTTTSYNTSSDARLKDVTGSARGLEVINELNPVSYNWKADGKADEGLIAQEVLDVVPNAVSGSEEEMYQMDYSKLVVHLVAGMKEQQEQIETLKQEIREIREGG